MSPPPSSPSPRGPVLRASLRANAAPFTPAAPIPDNNTTGYVEVVHNSMATSGSQPVIQRRHSQNPTFIAAGKKRVSMHGNIGSSRRTLVSNPSDQNSAPVNGGNVNANSAKDQAKSFASDAFKKNAAKVYLAKKRAQDMANANNHSVSNKKDDARKAFARRQSQKALKRQAAEERNKKIDHKLELEARQDQSISTTVSTTSTPGTTTSTVTSTTPTSQAVADICQLSTSSLTSSRPTSTGSAGSAADVLIVPSINVTEDDEHLTTSDPAPIVSNDAAINAGTTDPNISNISLTDLPTSNNNTNNSPIEKLHDEPAVPALSINLNTVNTSSIQPIVKATAIAPRSAPVASSKLVASNSMSILPSCSVDIAQLPRASAISSAVMQGTSSSCTMSTVSGGSSFDSHYTSSKRGKQTAMMPSSGKWCDECAGVGLHIAAMMTTISGWRAEEERRSSNTSTSGKSTSSSSGGWKRRMSQSIIGVSHSSSNSTKPASDLQKEKQRLEQQVDVLTLTVQFLYERLQKQGAATADIADAVRRCT